MRMLKNIGWKFKVLLLAIVLVPVLCVAGTYLIHARSGLALIGAASNAAQLPCHATGVLVSKNQCVTWAGTGGGDLTAFVPVFQLVLELILAWYIYRALKNSERLLLMTKVLFVTAAILLAPVIAIQVNLLALPHSEQAIISASKVDGIYQVDKKPMLGFGPEDIGLHVFVSLFASAGLLGGILLAAKKDQNAYAGMKKEELFQ